MVRFGPFPRCPLISLGIRSVLHLPVSTLTHLRMTWSLGGLGIQQPLRKHSPCSMSFHLDETNLSGQIDMGNDRLPESEYPVDSAWITHFLLMLPSAWHSRLPNE